MFTGIVQGKGKIVDKRNVGGGMVFVVEADFDLTDPEEGESIAHNGVCLTARDISGRRYSVDVSPETLDRTNLGVLAPGRLVNLERALRLSDRLGGHLVSGHVDATARIMERKPLGDFVLFTFEVPTGLGRYIIEKGSITVDGISLTVAAVKRGGFRIWIIPHTFEVTNLRERKIGDPVNLEGDIIGKYVEKFVRAMQRNTSDGVDTDFLAKHGFI